MNCAPGDYLCIVGNCSGDVGGGTALFNYWEENNCPAAYAQAINTGITGALSYNPQQQMAMQAEVFRLFETYLANYTLTDNVTSSEFNPFQNTLLNLCINPTLPGICEYFLTKYCRSFNREQGTNSPTLTNFCGCFFLPDPDYLKYTLGNIACTIGASGCSGCTAGETGCTGLPACDPLCHRALTSQKAYIPTGNIITCPQTVCVIDNVVVNAQNSRVPGGINFNSVCSGCNSKNSIGCLCVVSGINVSSTLSSIGIGENFNQFCGTNSVCLVEDDQGNIISSGGCTGINPGNVPISHFPAAPNMGIVFIMILVTLLVLIVAIVARSTNGEKKENGT